MEETRIAMKTPTRWESGPRSIFPSDPIHLSYQEHLRQGCWTCIPAVVEKGLLPSVYKIGALQKSPGQCYKSRKRQEEVEYRYYKLKIFSTGNIYIENLPIMAGELISQVIWIILNSLKPSMNFLFSQSFLRFYHKILLWSQDFIEFQLPSKCYWEEFRIRFLKSFLK